MFITELIFVFLIGISLGSFANVLIYRLPRGESIVLPSSHCPTCQTPIKPYHNIPVLSWFFLRGKCANCEAKISKRYPIVEILGGIISMAVYLKIGLSIETFLVSLIFILLMALSFIDFDHRAVPDNLNLTVLTLAMINEVDIHSFFMNIENALIFAGGFALLRFYVSYFVKREAMGEGDIIVAGTLGAILGVYVGVFAVFVSALISIIAFMFYKDRELPFVPFLSLAIFLVWVFEQESIYFLNLILRG